MISGGLNEGGLRAIIIEWAVLKMNYRAGIQEGLRGDTCESRFHLGFLL